MFVLIHSPLAGPFTWAFVADELRRRGHTVVVPTLVDAETSRLPYWQQHADAVAQVLTTVPTQHVLVLVGHSGAGPILPAIRAALGHPVAAYLFVDAGLPRHNASRLQLWAEESPELAQQLQQMLQAGGRFPNWGDEDLREIVPDDNVRPTLMRELRPRGLSFYTEPIPVFSAWPDAPCGYIQLSAAYATVALQAQRLGWPVHTIEAGHFHMLVDPGLVTDIILGMARQLGKTASK